MTDIVERLRKLSEPMEWYTTADNVGMNLVNEAAAEIERLRWSIDEWTDTELASGRLHARAPTPDWDDSEGDW